MSAPQTQNKPGQQPQKPISPLPAPKQEQPPAETATAETAVAPVFQPKPPPSARSAKDLKMYLQGSGTPVNTIEACEVFLRGQPVQAGTKVIDGKAQPFIIPGKKEASGDDLFDFLVNLGVTEGTIRKAGHFLYGDEWEYNPRGVTLEDRHAVLQGEIKVLKEQLVAERSGASMLVHENRKLKERVAELEDAARHHRMMNQELAAV